MVLELYVLIIANIGKVDKTSVMDNPHKPLDGTAFYPRGLIYSF